MYKKENGFVSIITAATIMIILALITIGFTRVVQREQRQSLDRQLSRQALYAAESGINQAYNALLLNPLAPDEQLDDCDPTLDGLITNTVLDAEDRVEYTCILYDKYPSRLDYNISPDDSKILELRTFSGNPFTSINIEWGNSDPDVNNVSDLPDCGDARDFPSNRTDTIPVLKVDLTSLSNLDRSELLANSSYLYLSPCDEAGGAGFDEYDFRTAITGDNVIPVNCNGGSGLTPCSLQITFDLTTDSSDRYLARFRPVYTSANLLVEGSERTSSAPLTEGDVEFAGQYSIDVTARSADVLRRLRAAIPLSSIDDKPEAVLQSFQGFCKQLEIEYNNSIVSNCP